MGCGKKSYPTKTIAKQAKKKLNKKYKEKATNEYYCDICSGYHLTTMDKQESREMTRRRK